MDLSLESWKLNAHCGKVLLMCHVFRSFSLFVLTLGRKVTNCSGVLHEVFLGSDHTLPFTLQESVSLVANNKTTKYL